MEEGLLPKQDSGIVDPLLRHKTVDSLHSLSRSYGFGYVFAIRLPSAVKKKEKQAFDAYLKKIYGNKKPTLEEFLEETFFRRVLHGEVDLKTDGSSTEMLPALMNCVIDSILSFLHSLGSSHDAPVDVVKFISVEKNKIFICVRMSSKLSRMLADMAEYPVQLDESALDKLGIKITNRKGLIPAWVKYDSHMSDIVRVYDVPERPGEQDMIRSVDRLRLFYDKLSTSFKLWRLQRVLDPIKVTLKVYPSHNKNVLEEFHCSWAAWRHIFWISQPIDDIRDYFGESIAFYFLFVETMRRALALLLVLSIACTYGAYLLNDAQAGKLLLSLIVCIWWVFLVKYWRRKQSLYANMWGTDFELLHSHMNELANPNFHAEPESAPFDENVKILRPHFQKQVVGYCASLLVTSVFISLVVAFVAANRALCVEFPSLANTLSYVLAFQIKLWDQAWRVIAPCLTRIEQHPFLKTYDQSMAFKIFAFGFVNQFNAFFWVGFVSPLLPDNKCLKDYSCEKELSSNIEMVFPTLILMTGVGLLAPFIGIQYKYWKQKHDMKELRASGVVEDEDHYDISFLEAETKLWEYDGKSMTMDYMQIIFPLAFVAMFAPVAPTILIVLCYVALAIQQRCDAIKLTTLYRRPFPERAAGIGAFDPLLTFLNFACVSSVSGLMVIQYDLGSRLPGFAGLQQKLLDAHLRGLANILLFLLVLIVLVFMVLAFEYFVPNEDSRTRREKRRQQHQKIRLFDVDQTEFNERIEIKATSDWAASAHHEVEQMRPEHPLYLTPLVSSSI
eukprot:TRINITY_DN1567_c1_g1_i1.p1 TRINITY_DN1567_c1_g1~~TRINITY_DN1567_c1_g1_i1.p1  ORF type:complete len:798 (+),score=118.57 TRINITY_DN1567_c1_g1_i1:42-2396(+)